MIYLLPVLLNVPAYPATSVNAPIPRSGLVHEARSGHCLQVALKKRLELMAPPPNDRVQV